MVHLRCATFLPQRGTTLHVDRPSKQPVRVHQLADTQLRSRHLIVALLLALKPSHPLTTCQLPTRHAATLDRRNNWAQNSGNDDVCADRQSQTDVDRLARRCSEWDANSTGASQNSDDNRVSFKALPETWHSAPASSRHHVATSHVDKAIEQQSPKQSTRSESPPPPLDQHPETRRNLD
jgi:hypothetical protein